MSWARSTTRSIEDEGHVNSGVVCRSRSAPRPGPLRAESWHVTQHHGSKRNVRQSPLTWRAVSGGWLFWNTVTGIVELWMLEIGITIQHLSLTLGTWTKLGQLFDAGCEMLRSRDNCTVLRTEYFSFSLERQLLRSTQPQRRHWVIKANKLTPRKIPSKTSTPSSRPYLCISYARPASPKSA